MDFESCQSGNQPMKKRVAEVCKVCRRLKSRHVCARGKMCVCKEFVARKKMDVVGRKKMESSVNLMHEQRLGSCFVEEYAGLQNLIQWIEQLYSSGDAPSGGVALPFILVQTRPHATVEVEISEDTHWCTSTLIAPLLSSMMTTMF